MSLRANAQVQILSNHKDYQGRGAQGGHLNFHTAPELWGNALSSFVESVATWGVTSAVSALP